MKVFGKVCFFISVIAAGLGIIAVIKKPDSVYKNEPSERNPMEGKK